ncbi:MAG: hypothetical protein K5931_07225 [Lachnospiraceae bacterium]|nr:hypothetical protein [Lachnospiraceae bacterium]
MKKETLNISCPNCGSSFSFDASRGKLKCEYCGYETAAEEMESFFLFDRKDGNDLEEKKNRNCDFELVSLKEKISSFMVDSFLTCIIVKIMWEITKPVKIADDADHYMENDTDEIK